MIFLSPLHNLLIYFPNTMKHLHLLSHHNHKKSEHHSKVLLTGASGFLAAHILDQLLKFGYEVKATVRSESKAQFLRTKYSDFPLEVVIVADIQDPHGFDHVFDSKITAVIHTASPVVAVSPGGDPLTELLNPALKGTTNILNAIKRFAPQVTHVVLTSSNTAIAQDRDDPTITHTEETWAKTTWEEAISNPLVSYIGSKKYAEKALWDFIENEKPNFVGTAVNPPFLFGKLIQQISSINQLNQSSNMINKLLFESDPSDVSSAFAERVFPYLDVQDAAHAHILALEKPETAGKRLLIGHEMTSNQQILDIAHKNFPLELNGKAPIGQPGTGTDFFRYKAKFDGSKTDALLGFRNAPIEKVITDAIESILELRDELK